MPACGADFAERHGPTVLMVAGMVLMLAAGAAALLDRPWPSLGSIAAVGLLALALGALLGRMEGRFKILGLSGTLRPNGGTMNLAGDCQVPLPSHEH